MLRAITMPYLDEEVVDLSSSDHKSMILIILIISTRIIRQECEPDRTTEEKY